MWEITWRCRGIPLFGGPNNDDDGCGGDAWIGGIDAVDATWARCDHDDVDLEPAICLDAVHQAVSGRASRQPAGDPDHLHHRDRAADLLLAGAGLSGRPLRPAPPDRRGLP